MKNILKLHTFDEVEIKEIEWLWKPYLPKGKLCIIEGEPGSGKTTIVLQIAALLTKGLDLPFGEDNEIYEPMNVIYQTAEDGYDDTIVPRFIEADGDLKKMYFINDDEIPLSMLDQRIEEAILQTNAGLFILDPIQAYLGSKVNMNMANEVRPLLKNLGDIAARTNCCIVLIGHFNKNSKDKAINRLSGTIDFMAACRSALIVTQYGKDKEQRNVIHLKSSLSYAGDNFCFYLRKDEGFTWGEIITLSMKKY